MWPSTSVALLLAALLLAAPSQVSSVELVICSTTKGPVALEIHPDWSPRGAARFLELVEHGFFDRSPLFRCVDGFLCQFGLPRNLTVQKAWAARGPIRDDPRHLPVGMATGVLSFAGAGPNSRTTQLFLTLATSRSLGGSVWETPIGRVVGGMDALRTFYTGYGDLAAFGGTAMDPSEYSRRGYGWAQSQYPRMDYFQRCTVGGGGAGEAVVGEAAGMSAASRPTLWLAAAAAMATVACAAAARRRRGALRGCTRGPSRSARR